MQLLQLKKLAQKNTTPVVVDEKTTYNGVLKDVVSEKTGQMVEAAAGVIGTLTGKKCIFSKKMMTTKQRLLSIVKLINQKNPNQMIGIFLLAITI